MGPDTFPVRPYSMAMFGESLRTLPATVMFYLFDALIRPILMYGSDIWGCNKWGTQIVDRLFQNFVRCTLHKKVTTCNPIVYGECGRFRPSVYCHTNVLCDYRRMMTSSNGKSFRVIGHLCGEFTGARWIHRTKASDAELWSFLWSSPA